jgi:hypothetical protein
MIQGKEEQGGVQQALAPFTHRSSLVRRFARRLSLVFEILLWH